MEPIKDGLKCWLEGSDLTSSSTNWNDKSGNNNNFSITGTPVAQNNMAVFSGDWYAKIDNLNINYGTIELTASFSSDVFNDNIYAYGSWEVNNYKYGLGNYRIVARSKKNSNNTIFNRLLGSDINELKTYGMTFNENTCVIYYEGQIIETIKNIDVPNIISFYLGYKSDSNKKGIGNIKSLKIYDRKLEPYEILANYQYELLNRNSNSYVNENNLPKIVDKLSNASNIKITGNKYGNRVQTVIDKIVEKADDVTKAIDQEVVNNSYSFKVGTGDVDVSTDVEDGFGEVGIKGVTYQNIAYKNTSIPLNCSYSKETGEGIVNYNASHLVSFNFSTDLLKPNTLYTVIINIKENSLVTTSGNSLKLQMADNNIAKYVTNGFVGQLKATISTKEISSSFGIVTVTAGATEGRVVFDGYMVLEGNHVDKSNIPSKISNIVGVGDKSKNLFNGELYSGWKDTFYDYGKADNIITGFIKVELGKSYIINNAGFNYIFGFDIDLIYIEFIQKNSFTNTNYSYVRFGKSIAKANTPNKDTFKELQIQEGTISTKYEPCYDGYKIEILSNGKNLYNIHNDITLTYGISKIEEGVITTNTLTSYATFGLVNNLYNSSSKIFDKPTKIIKGKKYSISCKIKRVSGEGNLNYFAIFGFNESENKYINSGISYTDISNINLSEDWLEFKYSNVATDNFDTVCPCFQVPSNVNNLILQVKDIQIEEADVSTSYDYFKSDKTQILLDEPLMRLPNGVCDEITRDGKLIRRIGKYTIDGSEGGTWYFKEELDYVRFWNGIFSTLLNPKLAIRTEIEMLCYTFPIYCNDSVLSTTNGHGISNTFYRDSIDKQIQIKLPKSSLTSLNSDGIKNWLKANPTTVYYELAEPIITELPAPYLRIFKDGHLTFNTLVAPESNHVVQLNKSGQIQNAIKESQLLDNRINVLENNYDNLMLSTISRLNDLELDYTLK